MKRKHFDITSYIPGYLKSFERFEKSAFVSFRPAPQREVLVSIISDIFELLFPGRSGTGVLNRHSVVEVITSLMEKVAIELEEQLFLAWFYENPLGLNDDQTHEYSELAKDTITALLENLPDLRIMMKEDAEAALDGDPAARSIHEIILAYPGVCALTMHRISHFLFEKKVPLIPRMIGEIIHTQTGIDIHPGATIGRSLFIDHGTGVVIGETTVIGDHVKIYQGVTLGALSFPKDSCGALIKGAKRHPTVGDYVTVYANATILGDITIGEHSIIGSSAWVHNDIPSYSFVQNEDPRTIIRERTKKAQR